MKIFYYFIIKINYIISHTLNKKFTTTYSNAPIKYIQNLLVQEKNFILIAR